MMQLMMVQQEDLVVEVDGVLELVVLEQQIKDLVVELLEMELVQFKCLVEVEVLLLLEILDME